MPRYGIVVMCAVLLVILGVSALSAQTGGAMLYSNGTVKVNGHDAGNATSLLNGDRVDVSASSAGSINRNGSSIVVSPNSSVQYAPSSVEILQGSARVSTNKGMSVKVNDVLVSPQSTAAKFEVTKSGDKVLVVSREGAVTVKDGTQTKVIQAGSSLAFASGGSPAVAQQTNDSSGSFLPQDRLVDHPFYGVVNGVQTTPPRLPICADILTCIRPSISKIHACCCPPLVQCGN